jgi:hypothetical protein
VITSKPKKERDGEQYLLLIPLYIILDYLFIRYQFTKNDQRRVKRRKKNTQNSRRDNANGKSLKSEQKHQEMFFCFPLSLSYSLTHSF